jgi:hypothetical protein
VDGMIWMILIFVALAYVAATYRIIADEKRWWRQYWRSIDR